MTKSKLLLKGINKYKTPKKETQPYFFIHGSNFIFGIYAIPIVFPLSLSSFARIPLPQVGTEKIQPPEEDDARSERSKMQLSNLHEPDADRRRLRIQHDKKKYEKKGQSWKGGVCENNMTFFRLKKNIINQLLSSGLSFPFHCLSEPLYHTVKSKEKQNSYK
ncbi:hypothetical protein GGS20DRAFT_336499 [Poronia punctata]|nr:hypothetical protein GGS20DRAFT_336499 [Poronia punctata]